MVHPGASWSTADVHNGLRFGLSAAGAQTANYQLDVRIARSGQWLNWNWRKADPAQRGPRPNPRDIQYHAGEGLVTRALRIEPDWILIVSGMYLDIEIVRHLRRCGFKLACLLTESPYDDLAQAEFINTVDVCWTNERTSVPRLRAAAPRTEVFYLPHAWHPLIHVDQEPADATPRHDVLFIGTGFPERVALLADADFPPDMNVALYGHWTSLGSRSRLRRYLKGSVVANEQAADLYRAATINLNLMRRRQGWGGDAETELVAESVNPRVMELAALGRFFLSDHRAELDDIFPGLVPTFSSGEELAALAEDWLDPARTQDRRERGYALQQAVQSHSWVHRAHEVLSALRGARPRQPGPILPAA